MPHLRSLIVAVLLALLSIAPPNAARADDVEGGKGAKKLDDIWVHPQFDASALRSVALLPAASFNHDIKTEKEIEAAWAQSFRSTGYRWFSSTLSKELLKNAFGGDSVLTAINAALLKNPRVDSLSARALCRALHTSAVVSVRADQWEQTQIEWNQSGEPWTTVQLKASLVDSLGRLLWTASGSETAKGQLHTAGENSTLGVKSSGLGLQPVTAEAGAPSFQEVLARLFGRWVARFPAKAAPAAAAPSGGN